MVAHRTLPFTALFLVLHLLIGCSKAIIVPNDISINNNDHEHGIVLYSLSKLPYDHIFNQYVILISNREYKKLDIPLRLATLYDVKEDSIRIFYDAIKLPAGEYVMRGWQMNYRDSYGRLPFGIGPSSQFHIPFTVFGGKVNYLGDYLAVVTQNKNLSGSQTGFGGYFIVSNRFETDFAAIQQKFRKLGWNETLNCVPNFTKYNKKYTGMMVKGINVP